MKLAFGVGFRTLAYPMAFAAAQVLLGTGLLRLREHARVASIVYFCLMAVNGVLTLAPPGWAARIEIMHKEMPRLFPAGVPAQMPEPGWVFVLMGIAFAAIPLWFLVRQRAAFLAVTPKSLSSQNM